MVMNLGSRSLGRITVHSTTKPGRPRCTVPLVVDACRKDQARGRPYRSTLSVRLGGGEAARLMTFTRMDPMRRGQIVSNAMLARLAAVGADPRDHQQTRQSKALLVLISVLILPIAVVWGSLYLIFGSPVGYVPFAYALV